MPIWYFEKCSGLGLEQQALLNVPYRRALALLHLGDRHDDPLCETVAYKVKEVHERGVRSAIGISNVVVRELTHYVNRARGDMKRPSGRASGPITGIADSSGPYRLVARSKNRII